MWLVVACLLSSQWEVVLLALEAVVRTRQLDCVEPTRLDLMQIDALMVGDRNRESGRGIHVCLVFLEGLTLCAAADENWETQRFEQKDAQSSRGREM